MCILVPIFCALWFPNPVHSYLPFSVHCCLPITTTASADFCMGALLRQFARLRLRLHIQISHGKLLFVPVKIAGFTTHCLRLAVGFPVQCQVAQMVSLLSCFCSSVPTFAACFLQIPPRGRYPCYWLWFPLTGPFETLTLTNKACMAHIH